MLCVTLPDPGEIGEIANGARLPASAFADEPTKTMSKAPAKIRGRNIAPTTP